jgi:hypothetical protein
MLHMKTFPRPTEGNDQDNKSGQRGGLLLLFTATPDGFPSCAERSKRLTETLGFPAVQYRSITRAVDEALTNDTAVASSGAH